MQAKIVEHLEGVAAARGEGNVFRVVYHDLAYQIGEPRKAVLAELKRLHKAGVVTYWKSAPGTRHHAGTWYLAGVELFDVGELRCEWQDYGAGWNLAVWDSKGGMVGHPAEAKTKQAALASMVAQLKATGLTGRIKNK